jgi:hypothetical protein
MASGTGSVNLRGICGTRDAVKYLRQPHHWKPSPNIRKGLRMFFSIAGSAEDHVAAASSNSVRLFLLPERAHRNAESRRGGSATACVAVTCRAVDIAGGVVQPPARRGIAFPARMGMGQLGLLDR